ncbi:MAG: AAA family ATPase [Bacteroidetes bacterium]|nr:AAA family ATPase [Fibrella sp.]
MENFIDHLMIENFKSIRELTVSGFNRINLFIGRPNVGKSNILEAMSLFSLPYVWEGSKKLIDLVRLEDSRELFYDGNISADAYVQAWNEAEGSRQSKKWHAHFQRGTGGLFIEIFDHSSIRVLQEAGTTWFNYETDAKFKLTNRLLSEKDMSRWNIKSYHFNVGVKYKEIKYPFLIPPSGSNLLYVLELMPEFKELYTQWFKQYGLRLVSDRSSQSLKILKDKGDEILLLPYSSVADTLQRIIFYKTAVASNENSVLLFEEPEAHAYPPYISEFTQEVIKSTTNQFFIVTHSPLIVNDFLEGAIDDLGIFMVDFKDGQTVVRPLSKAEIREVHQYGVDLFFNNEAYLA